MLLSFAFWGYYTKLFCKKNGKVCTFYEKNVNVKTICMCETAKIRLEARKTVAKSGALCYHLAYSFIPLKSAGSFWGNRRQRNSGEARFNRVPKVQGRCRISQAKGQRGYEMCRTGTFPSGVDQGGSSFLSSGGHEAKQEKRNSDGTLCCKSRIR